MVRRNIIGDIMRENEAAEPMWVCKDCLKDSMLKCLTVRNNERHTCSGCGLEKMETLTPRRIANFIREHLPKHFEVDRGIYPGYEMSLDDLLAKAIVCDSQVVCRSIAQFLEDSRAGEDDFYWPGQCYSRTRSPFDSQEHERWFVMGEWQQITRELVHGRRFFNSRAHRFFESLIGEALAARREGQDAAAVMTEIEPGTSFYRARLASGLAEARKFADNPAADLGAPPKERAANNRMSAAGVPLLYVSADPHTCIAEIRPSIGDTIAVGKFNSTAALKFFDFNALSHRLEHEPLSFFESDYQKRDHHRTLLHYLHEEIARPVRSSDIDYVMTQALAEYIRDHQPGAFDGISFRSVQREGGVNFVLFDNSKNSSLSDPDWRPTFSLAIEPRDVEFHEVEAVTYRSKTIGP